MDQVIKCQRNLHQQQIGKEINILLDKEARIYRCDITEHHQNKERQITPPNQEKFQQKLSERQLVSHQERNFKDGVGLWVATGGPERQS